MTIQSLLEIPRRNKNYLAVAKKSTVMSKSVANPWRYRKIAVLAGQKAVKSWIRPLRGK
jgi:hypothetical protein